MQIYVHIPFCEQKCKYCSFNSSRQTEEVQATYFFALNNEIKRTASILRKDKKNMDIETIYIGGGTPSAVKAEFITNLLSVITSNFSVSKTAEITIEANPNSIAVEKLSAYIHSGVNRISFGAQSFDDNALKILGRTHNSAQIFQAVKTAQEVGFKNISIDLILGVNKINNLEENIKILKNNGLTHISAYMLMLEENTPLKYEVEQGQTKVLNEDESVEEYEKVCKVFERNGYKRYETSNFSIKGYESRHNMGYWQMQEYIGFGLSAHSYYETKRFYNTESLSKYLQKNKDQNNFKKQPNLQNRAKSQIDLNNLKIIKNIQKINIFDKKMQKNIKLINFLQKNNKKTENINKKKFLFKGQTIFDNCEKLENLTTNQQIEETIMLGLRTREGVEFRKLLNLGYDIKKERATELENLQSLGAIKVDNKGVSIAPKFYGVQNQIILKLLPE